jgi:hypothetical protein
VHGWIRARWHRQTGGGMETGEGEGNLAGKGVLLVLVPGFKHEVHGKHGGLELPQPIQGLFSSREACLHCSGGRKGKRMSSEHGSKSWAATDEVACEVPKVATTEKQASNMPQDTHLHRKDQGENRAHGDDTH